MRQTIDPALTDETLAVVVARALSVGTDAVRVRGYRVLTGGCWNRVISVGVETVPHASHLSGPLSDLVFKISPHENDPAIIREFDVLTFFAELSDFPVPRPLYLDAAPPRFHTTTHTSDAGALLPGTTLVMTRLPGGVMHQLFGRLSASQRRLIMEQLTDDVIRLHGRTSRGFGGVELSATDRQSRWPAFWLPRLEEVIHAVRDAAVFPESLFRTVERLWPFLEKLLEIGEVSTLTHYDIWSGNVMIDPAPQEAGTSRAAAPRISGYIDIPGYWADYARELSFMQVFGLADEAFMERYREVRGLDNTFELRVRAYQLRTFMKHVMMYPSEGYYRRGTELSLNTLVQAAGV